jgi:hypothetical protein
LEEEIALGGSEYTRLNEHLVGVEQDILRLTEALDAPQRAYQRYQEELALWQKERTTIEESIASLSARRETLRSTAQDELVECRKERSSISTRIHEQQLGKAAFQRGLYGRLQTHLSAEPLVARSLPLKFDARLIDSGFAAAFNSLINHTNKGRFSEPGTIEERVKATDLNDPKALALCLEATFAELLDGKDIDNVERQLKKAQTASDLYELLFGLEYLEPRYSIRVRGRELIQLTPGERGSVLLVFYLLADKDDRPLIIDQPEENLDNQSM